MVKDVAVALLTTTINRYSDRRFAGDMIPKGMVIKDLTGILDYVADIPEDKQPMTVVLNSEAETLRERIREFEETCTDNTEIIKAQFKKIEALKEDNCKYQYACNTLREKIKSLEGK